MAEVQEELPAEEQKVLIWALIGPLCLLATLAICLVKARAELYYHLPLVMMAGLVTCWRYRYRGLAAITVVLAVITAYQLTIAAEEELFWVLGLAIAVTVALLTATLAFDEVETVLASIRTESNSRLNNLWNLDEKLKLAQQHWKGEREGLMEQVSRLSEENAEHHTQLTSWRRAVSFVRHELEEAQAEQDRLLEELYNARAALSRAQAAPSAQTAPAARDRRRESEQRLLAELNRIRCDLFQLKLDRSSLSYAARPSDSAGQNVALWRRLREAQAMYKQLREQFQDKSCELEKVRKELFLAQEQCLRFERERADDGMVPLEDVETMLAERLQHQRDEEIEALEQLVSTLMAERE